MLFTTFAGKNVVDADNAVAIELTIDVSRRFANALCRTFGNAGGRNLVTLALVFGIVIKEFASFEGNFCDGEANHIAVLATKTTASDFGSDQLPLDHHFIAFIHRLMNGGNHFFEGFHFAHTEGAAAGIGLDETRESDALDDFLRSGQRLSATHHQAVADMDAGKCAKIIIKRELVESKCLNKYATGAVRETDQVEITLENTVLAGRTMDGDVSEIEGLALAVYFIREVVEIDGILAFSI